MAVVLQKHLRGTTRAAVEADLVAGEIGINEASSQLELIALENDAVSLLHFPSLERLDDITASSSGASLIGVEDDSFTNITGDTDLQTTLKSIDNAIGSTTGTLLQDGSRPLTAEWDTGAFNIDLGGILKLTKGTQDYWLTDRSNTLAIQGQTAASDAILELFSKDGDGTDHTIFRVYGVGTPSDITDAEFIDIRYDQTGIDFRIFTQQNGSGTLRPLVLYTEGNTDQLRLGTGGDVAMKAGNLLLQRSTGVVFTIENTGNDGSVLVLDGDRASAGNIVGDLSFHWNGTAIASIRALAGDDTGNKDEGDLVFLTAEGGSLSERMRITQEGHLEITDGTPKITFNTGSTNYGTIEGDITGGSGGGATMLTIHGRNDSLTVCSIDFKTGTSADDGEILLYTSIAGSNQVALKLDENQNVDVQNGELQVENGVLRLGETTTPTADTNYGKIYTKTDNKIYFQDGAGTEHEIAFV